MEAAYCLKLTANLVQIAKDVEFLLNPVWKPVFQS